MVQIMDACANAVVLLAGDVPKCDLPVCQYGGKCYRKNPYHFEQFQHPDERGYSHTRASVSLEYEVADLHDLLCDRYLVLDDLECTFDFIGESEQIRLTADAQLRDAVLRSCSGGATMVLVATFTRQTDSVPPERCDSSVDALHSLIARLAL